MDSSCAAEQDAYERDELIQMSVTAPVSGLGANANT
eukprot:gene30383-4810_t